MGGINDMTREEWREIMTPVLYCGRTFYSCDDSTDEAPHSCDLKNHHKGEHHCKCGVWGSC